MWENIILGVVQGITEWLPVSSEGIFFLIKVNLFKEISGIEAMVKMALFLHFGTLLAVIVYFYRDILSLLKALFNYKSASIENRQILKFLIISTFISGLLGFLLLKLFAGFYQELNLTGRAITILIGLLLLITAFLQLKAKKKQEYKQPKELTNFDSILLGLVQGLAVLPGLSRSGLTVSALLLRKFDDAVSLKLSFLMSLPIVLTGNIILNSSCFSFSLSNFLGLFFAFLFGLLTIDLLLKLAKKINFGWFVLLFGAITLLAALI